MFFYKKTAEMFAGSKNSSTFASAKRENASCEAL
jgi:hypothetical protein